MSITINKTIKFSTELVPFIGLGFGTHKHSGGRQYTFFVPFILFNIVTSVPETNV